MKFALVFHPTNSTVAVLPTYALATEVLWRVTAEAVDGSPEALDVNYTILNADDVGETA